MRKRARRIQISQNNLMTKIHNEDSTTPPQSRPKIPFALKNQWSEGISLIKRNTRMTVVDEPYAERICWRSLWQSGARSRSMSMI